MPEPVGIVGMTIAVAGLAYKSTKSLWEFIDNFQNAPKLMLELKEDVASANACINSIRSILEDRDTMSFPADLLMSLEPATRQLQRCEAVTKAFEEEMKGWSPDSFRRKVKFDFKEKRILEFKRRLHSTQDDLDRVLLVCNTKFNGIRAEEAKEFEMEMVKQVHLVNGRLQGLQITRDEIFNVAEGLSQQNHEILSLHRREQGEIAGRLGELEEGLRDSLKLCSIALLEAEKKTGHRVKLAKSMDEAKQLISVLSNGTGDMGTPVEIGEMYAHDKSRQVGVTNDANFALKFLE